jgi:hypothetical protein
MCPVRQFGVGALLHSSHFDVFVCRLFVFDQTLVSYVQLDQGQRLCLHIPKQSNKNRSGGAALPAHPKTRLQNDKAPISTQFNLISMLFVFIACNLLG